MAEDNNEVYALRVREAASSIATLANSSINFPLNEYVNRSDIDALFDSLSLDFDQWTADDLRRILIIRDGLYQVTQHLRDKGDDSIHSIERLIDSFSRLYVDLERALLELAPSELAQARESLALARSSRLLPARNVGDVRPIVAASTEVTTQARITSRHIEINLLKIENINLDIFKIVNLTVKRFSATAFAIKINLETKVIFQGIMNFLSSSADRIFEEVKKFVSSISTSYENLGVLIQDLDELVKVGGRFTKLVSGYIRQAFGAPETLVERSIDFDLQRSFNGRPLYCGALTRNHVATFGGKGGQLLQIELSSTKSAKEGKYLNVDINSVASVQSAQIALGTADGLDLIGDIGGGRTAGTQAAYNENVVSLVTPTWGGLGVAIVTGSRDGFLRRWTLAGGLTRYSQDIDKKLGKSITKIILLGNQIAVASGETIYVIDENFTISSRIDARMAISDMCRFDENSLLVCGHGRIGVVNLVSGNYTRMTSDAPEHKYSAICKLNDEVYCSGTENGRVSAAELTNGVEIGHFDTEIHIRGLLLSGNKLFAYGGPRNSQNTKNLAILVWKQDITAN